MYKVLYRKWRPKVFDDVAGQSHITSILKNEISSHHVAHAYMFCGARGTGKTTCAKILAKAVNCLNPQNGNPCLECKICLGIDSGSILDVSEIDAASNNGVENIRNIREEANFVASEANFRVYIIDEFHMLSSGAFNAILKILEEPPAHVIFVLATTEFYKIPKTVISRCQKFDFFRVNSKDIKTRLEFVAKQEKINFQPEAIDLISKVVDGSLRDALSILDQCYNNNNTIDIDCVNSSIGFFGQKNIENLAFNIISKDLSSNIKDLSNIYSNGKEATRLCEELMAFFREIFVFQITNEIDEECVYDSNLIKKSAEILILDESIACFDILKECYVNMLKFPDKKTEIELAIIKIYKKISSLGTNLNIKSAKNNKIKEEPDKEKKYKQDDKFNIIKNSLDEIENQEEIKINIKKKPIKEINQYNESDITQNLNNEIESDQNKKFDLWPEVIKGLEKDIPKYVLTILQSADAYTEDKLFLIKAEGDFAIEAIKKIHKKIQEVILKITGKNYKVSSKKVINKKSNDLFGIITDEAKSSGIDIKIN
ncbi:MAG: DNA polymerase III subunit gamma/tau [Oscillospiraceae bacterium]|nr:DNA polymerase III subunit gamma/tau [Oscillospiraceae bacterium]